MSLALAKFDEGDILKFKGIIYNHYAVYAGDDKIIHYQSEECSKRCVILKWSKASVIEESIQTYWQRGGKKNPVKAKLGPVDSTIIQQVFTGRKVVERARFNIGRECYHLGIENCEHFVNLCKYDVAISNEVEKKVGLGFAGAGGAIGGLIGGVLGTALVPGAGTVVGGAIGAGTGATLGRAVCWTGSKMVRIKRAHSSNGSLHED